jgi:hypothetical protein
MKYILIDLMNIVYIIYNQRTIINHLKYINEIYIVCRSTQRSQFIKDKYFAEQPNIKIPTFQRMYYMLHLKGCKRCQFRP